MMTCMECMALAVKFKTSMLRSSLCDYSNTYIFAKGTITVPNTTATDVDPKNRNKKVILKNYAPFTDCISEIKNTEIDHAKDTDVY